MQFLMGLDDVYQPIRSSLLTRDPIPDVKTAFSIISREESHRGSSSSSSGNKAQASVFVAKVHNNNNNFKKNLSTKNPNLRCTNPNCGLTSHTIEKCYKIIGYPEHIKKKWANNGNNNNQRSVSSNNSSTNTAEVPTYVAPSLTTDQIEQLINMLNSKPQSNIHANMAGLTPEENSGIGSQHRGHPSDQILKALRDRIDIRGNGDSALCDICHEAKYTREPFIICDHKTTNLGDIFHLDVWGPYRITSREGGIPLYLWSECVLTTTYLINRLPSSVLKETDSHGDNENSFALGGTNKDSSDSNSTSLRDFNDATNRELVTAAYDDITIEQSFTSEDNQNIINANSDQPNLKRSSRTSKLPTKLSDFVLDDKVKYGINKHVNYSNLSKENYCFSTNLNETLKPSSYHEARTNKDWEASMNTKMESLNRNNTIVITNLPP
ncbi:hypothetical protein Tco_0361166 [Tanacetum coccineum]